MAINKFYIKKWFKMMTGKSILHVNQLKGSHFKLDSLEGYYNDLIEKVTKSNLAPNEIPITELPNGEKIEFSISIFQYGLGAYDLYLANNDKKNLERFFTTVRWAVDNQDNNGGWKSFKENEVNSYSAMAQSEGVSLLLRAFKETKNKLYFDRATVAISLMLNDEKSGGCTQYIGDDVVLKEYPLKSIVLNGWIFSIFGLYDYLLVEKNEKIKNIYNQTIHSLKRQISKFDAKYWSKYDDDYKLASPFYHQLHVELLDALYDITGEITFKKYANIFSDYSKKKSYKMKAFLKKSFQKIKEK